MIPRFNLRNLWCIIGLTVYVCAILWPNITFFRCSHCMMSTDNLQCAFPLIDLFSEGLKKGHITCWVPYIWNGMPLFGGTSMPFSPVFALILLISNKVTIHAFLELHFLLEIIFAAIGFFFLSSYWLKNRSYRFFAAILYVSSTGVAVYSNFYAMTFHFAAIPWVLFFLHKMKERMDVSSAALIAIVIHMQLTYGALQFNLYSLALYFLYAIFLHGDIRQRIRLTGTLVLSCVFAVLLSAYYLFPFVDNLLNINDNLRLGVSVKSIIANNTVPWEYLIRLITPGLFDASGGMTWWPAEKEGWSLLEAFTAYQGALGGVTILYGIFFLGRRLKFWRAMYIFIILMCVTPLGVLLSYLLHFGSSVPYGRITALLGLPGAFICFSVFERLSEDRKFLKRYIGCIFICALLLTVFSMRPAMEKFVAHLFMKAGTPLAHGQFLKQFFHPMGIVAHRTIALLAFYGIGFLVILFARQKVKVYILLLLVSVNTVELVTANNLVRFGSRTKREGRRWDMLDITKAHPMEKTLQRADLAEYRIHHLSGFGGFRNFKIPEFSKYRREEGEKSVFRLGVNCNVLGKLPMTTGYTSLVPNNQLLVQLFFRTKGSFFRACSSSPVISQGFLNRFSIKYLIGKAYTPITLEVNSMRNNRLRLLYFDDDVELTEVYDVAPRFYLPAMIYTLKTDQDVINSVTAADFDPRKISYVRAGEKGLPAAVTETAFPDGTAPRILVIKNDCDEIELTVTTGCRRVLGTSNPWHPWWGCLVNGKPGKIFKINSMFSGILVPEGDSVVKFYCRPVSLKIGLAVSCMAYCFLMLCGALKIFKTARR